MINAYPRKCGQSFIYQKIYLFYENTDIFSYLEEKFTNILSHLNSLWQKARGNSFCAIFGGNAKGYIVLSKVTQGSKDDYYTQAMPRLIYKLI